LKSEMSLSQTNHPKRWADCLHITLWTDSQLLIMLHITMIISLHNTDQRYQHYPCTFVLILNWFSYKTDFHPLCLKNQILALTEYAATRFLSIKDTEKWRRLCEQEDMGSRLVFLPYEFLILALPLTQRNRLIMDIIALQYVKTVMVVTSWSTI
jgi:hypothetical protein